MLDKPKLHDTAAQSLPHRRGKKGEQLDLQTLPEVHFNRSVPEVFGNRYFYREKVKEIVQHTQKQGKKKKVDPPLQ